MEAQEAAPLDDENLLDEEALEAEKGQDADSREALEQELESVRDQLMRIAAEFENYKKRMEREQAKMARYAGENILRDLLPTVDNLERALEQGAEGSVDPVAQLGGLLEGVELTQKSLLATLERFGVQPVESVGRPFNPGEQDALTMEASSEVPANHVVREFAKGYRFKDRMLRHAQVVVSSGPGK
ncbi:MAG: nucleotide exchange factor GrpE [bacterium]|nr:nucleotide exchange factor GrpE [bacterium]